MIKLWRGRFVSAYPSFCVRELEGGGGKELTQSAEKGERERETQPWVNFPSLAPKASSIGGGPCLFAGGYGRGGGFKFKTPFSGNFNFGFLKGGGEDRELLLLFLCLGGVHPTC